MSPLLLLLLGEKPWTKYLYPRPHFILMKTLEKGLISILLKRKGRVEGLILKTTQQRGLSKPESNPEAKFVPQAAASHWSQLVFIPSAWEGRRPCVEAAFSLAVLPAPFTAASNEVRGRRALGRCANLCPGGALHNAPVHLCH